MNKTEFIDFALAGWEPNERKEIVEMLSEDFPPGNHWYSWMGYVPGFMIESWPTLDIRNRIIVYLMANYRFENT